MDTVASVSGNRLIDLRLSFDLRIVNGRISEFGQFTNIATNGKSLIDYALATVDSFPVIGTLNVHDMFSFSTHLSMSVNLCFTCPNVEDTEDEIVIDAIVWDENKSEQLTNNIQTNITVLQICMDSIK